MTPYTFWWRSFFFISTYYFLPGQGMLAWHISSLFSTECSVHCFRNLLNGLWNVFCHQTLLCPTIDAFAYKNKATQEYQISILNELWLSSSATQMLEGFFSSKRLSLVVILFPPLFLSQKPLCVDTIKISNRMLFRNLVEF